MLEGLLAAHRRYDELSAQLSQPDAASDIGQILFGNHAAGRKHLSVSKRPSDVGGRHALVKAHRLGISEHELGNGFGETTRPCFLLGMQRIG